uniref:Uncharacterized protein n=1 Tax=Opuntia streptacantha TaxID=393608 RepID=A0A7C9AA22_OPUST
MYCRCMRHGCMLKQLIISDSIPRGPQVCDIPVLSSSWIIAQVVILGLLCDWLPFRCEEEGMAPLLQMPPCAGDVVGERVCCYWCFQQLDTTCSLLGQDWDALLDISGFFPLFHSAGLYEIRSLWNVR